MALFGADTVRITVRGIAEEQAIVNVLHYMPPGPELGEIDAELSSLLSAFATAWKDKILPLLCSTYSVVDYHAVAVKGSEVFAAQNRPPHKGLTLGDEFTRTAGFGDEGVVGTAPLPTFCSMTWQKRTGKAGRKNRGALRLAPMPEADTIAAQGNQWTDAVMTQANNFADFLYTPLPAGGFGGDFLPCLLHSTELVANAPVAGTQNYRVAVTDAIVNRLVGTQLSRKQTRNQGR